MRKLLILALAVSMVAMLLPVAPARAATTFRASLSGMEEVPPVGTAAMGDAVFTLSDDGMTLSYTVTVSNISDPFAAHIHLAPAGVNGPVAVNLVASRQMGLFTGVIAMGTLTAANLTGPLAGMPLSSLVAQIQAGSAYVNVHTNANLGGEIRGQIMQLGM